MTAPRPPIPPLVMERLTVGHGSRPVLSELSRAVEAGQFLALLGPNGAGKTTLLRTLARLLAPLGGAVLVEGDGLAGLEPAALARRLAVVLTERPQPGQLTVRELVALGRQPHTGFLGRLGPTDQHKVEEALALVGALELGSRPLGQLSDGERQKVYLARALAQEPRVILLDEPTLHLDLRHRLEVMLILRRLCRREGIAVVASLHELDLAARVADLVALVGEGGFLAFGPPEEALTARAVTRLYGLDGAGFAPELGLLELGQEPGGERVFVAAGGGSGLGLFRALARRGFALASGPLAEHDVDCVLARALGAEVAVFPPFADPDPATLARARSLQAAARWTVDAGFPAVAATRAGLDLIGRALAGGGAVHGLRPPAEAAALWGGPAQGYHSHPSPPALAAALAEEPARPGRVASHGRPPGVTP